MLSMWQWNPETFAAVGTVSASVFAAAAAWVAVSELLSRRRADAERQARLVAAWTEIASTGHGDTPSLYTCRLHVANRSDLPVFRVQVQCDSRLGESSKPAFSWHSLGPGQEDTQDVWEADAHDALGYPGEVLRLAFVDHQSVAWVRQGGHLERQ